MYTEVETAHSCALKIVESLVNGPAIQRHFVDSSERNGHDFRNVRFDHDCFFRNVIPSCHLLSADSRSLAGCHAFSRLWQLSLQ